MQVYKSYSIELFNKPPKDKCFEELKDLCIRFWSVFTYLQPGYKTWSYNQIELEQEYCDKKRIEVEKLTNEGSNFIGMVQGIHQNYRILLARSLSLETRNEISMRLYAWNKDNEELDPFDVWNTENNKF